MQLQISIGSALGAASAAVGLLILVAAPALAQAPKLGDPPEAKNMRLVGYNDLQARSAYQPTIQKQGNRYIAYVGHHGGTPDVPKPVNKLNGQAEYNGTSIIDVTDPAQPKYLAHIPGLEGNYQDGGAQMVRVCDGKILPKGDPSKTYMLRVFGGSATKCGTSPIRPSRRCSPRSSRASRTRTRAGGNATPASLPRVRCAELARAPHDQVYDLSDPLKPVHIRDFGLVGQEPGATGAVPMELHGGVSTGPQGNRIYFGHGTNKGGVLQIVDREKLLKGPKEPTPDNLHYPEISRVEMLPFNGAHTVFPMLQMPVAEFAQDKDGKVRDIVMIVDEQIQ